MTKTQNQNRPDMTGFDRTEHSVAGVNTIVYAIGHGYPLLYLHGAGTFPGFDFARRLANHCRVIIPHHPGFGETADSAEAATMEGLVEHYARLVPMLDLGDFSLAGFSLGGWIAAEMAASGRFRISKLALIAPAGLVDHQHPVPDLSVVPPDALPGYLTHDPQIAGSYFPKTPDPGFGAALGREMTAFGRLLRHGPQGDPTLEARLPMIGAPTLLLWGREDRMRPFGQSEAWLRSLPRSELQALPAVGHLVFEEQPDAADLLQRFMLS